ncbi:MULTISPECIES: hypothetical protein [Pseudoalteromonas]|uniref:hypothetical protein n=1 Tax=Pseudoalteromonas TaxID=53246 RepID=UPI001F2D6F9D|nr:MULTISPECIES: hypothetical protein [Pseudoalteromonas]WFO20786.1 hypothetical protein ATS73_018760 [Pseudoalteromonas sp. H100]
MEELASLATIILAQEKGRRLSKYQLKDQIRIVFQHDGIIKFFTHFKKEHGIKNIKLGDSNDMSFSAAKLKATKNICNLRLSYIDDLTNPKFLTFPETTHIARGAIKNQKEFKIQLTREMREAIQQELKLNPDINRTYLFCKVKENSKPISKESLNRTLKYHAPKDMVAAPRDNINIKGSAGAFPTLLRSFLKSHMKEVLTKKIGSSTIAEIESKKMLHHSVSDHDPMSKHYDHSNKIYNTDIKALYKNFSLFEKEVLKEVKIQAR